MNVCRDFYIKCENTILSLNATGIIAAQKRSAIWIDTYTTHPTERSRIRTALDGIDPLADISTFNNECGIDFWTGSLTYEEINELLAANVGIKHIIQGSKANYHQDDDGMSITVDNCKLRGQLTTKIGNRTTNLLIKVSPYGKLQTGKKASSAELNGGTFHESTGDREY